MFLPNGAAANELRSEQGATFFVIALPMLADLAAARGNPAVGHPVTARGRTRLADRSTTSGR